MAPRLLRAGLLVAGLLLPGLVTAHLMPAQRGSLNLVGDGAYLVLSLPVSLLTGVDRDSDGRLSAQELQEANARIRDQLLRRIALRDPHGARPIEGVMLSLTHSHEVPDAPADQIVLMGRFALRDPALPLRLHLDLRGAPAAQGVLRVIVTRGKDRQWLEFDAQRRSASVLPANSTGEPTEAARPARNDATAAPAAR